MISTAAPVEEPELEPAAPADPAPASEPRSPDPLGPAVTSDFSEVLSLDDLLKAKRRGDEPAPVTGSATGPEPKASPAAAPTPGAQSLEMAAWVETVRTLEAAGSAMGGVAPGAIAVLPDGSQLDGVEMLGKQTYALAAYYMNKAPSVTSLYVAAAIGVAAYASLKYRLVAAAKAQPPEGSVTDNGTAKG